MTKQDNPKISSAKNEEMRKIMRNTINTKNKLDKLDQMPASMQDFGQNTVVFEDRGDGDVAEMATQWELASKIIKTGGNVKPYTIPPPESLIFYVKKQFPRYNCLNPNLIY